MTSSDPSAGPDSRRPVRAYAHRGGAYHPELEGLENTLEAFRHAVALGYRYLETDVHVTRDGVLLAFHDAVLDRVTDRHGAVADLTLAEIRHARIGGHHHIPTLDELFDAFPNVEFNIDLKSDAAVEALAGFLAARDAEDRVIVGSFSPRRLATFRKLTGGRVRTSAHPIEVIAFRFLPHAGLADLVTRGKVSALQIPHRRGLGPLRVTVADRGLVKRAHAAGKEVHVWTVDDPDEMEELIERGVDGVMTNRTDLLRDVLERRGQWSGQEDDQENDQ